MCMKRQNLMIDPELLLEAQKTLGIRTFSETVNYSLKEAIRVQKLKKLMTGFGKVDWEGSVDEMRGRLPLRRKTK